VVATFAGSSAEAAGIKIGDVVYSLDGLPVSGLNEKQIGKALRGPVGSTLDVAVAHEKLGLVVCHISWPTCKHTAAIFSSVSGALKSSFGTL
jgi:membrane-associated protease RseP (regulator of RpoE activity)